MALRPEDREDYVATCDSMLEPGGKILLVTMKYEQSAKKGASSTLCKCFFLAAKLVSHAKGSSDCCAGNNGRVDVGKMPKE